MSWTHLAIILLFSNLSFGCVMYGARKRIKEAPGLGIDFGTTTSTVAVYHNGHTYIVSDEQDRSAIPSIVAFTPSGDRVVGYEAQQQASHNPQNTIFDLKRMVGRTFDDLVLQGDIQRWPFKVVNNNSQPLISITVQNQTQVYSPTRLISFLFSHLKQMAEARFNISIPSAVVAVSLPITEHREIIVEAGKLAGVEVLRVVLESTAAGFAYRLDQSRSEKTLLVVHVGGSTMELTVLVVDEGVFEVYGSKSLPELAGQVFLQRSVRHFAGFLSPEHRANPSVLSELTHSLQHALFPPPSTPPPTSFTLPSLNLTLPLSHSLFNSVHSDLYSNLSTSLSALLHSLNLQPSDIHHVLFTGSASRLPPLHELLANIFPDSQKLEPEIPAHEIAAQGAVLLASELVGEWDQEIISLNIMEVAMGVEVPGGMWSVVVPRYAWIPTKKSKIFTTSHHNQSMISFRIFDGMRPFVQHNRHLTTLNITLPPAHRDFVRVTLTLEIDHNADIHVEARLHNSELIHKTVLEASTIRLDQDEIERMAREREEFEGEDQARVELVREQLRQEGWTSKEPNEWLPMEVEEEETSA